MIAALGLLVGIVLGVDLPARRPARAGALPADRRRGRARRRLRRPARLPRRHLRRQGLRRLVHQQRRDRAGIVFLGDKLGVGGQLSTGVIVVLGIRIFSNVAAIRRHIFHA